MDRVDASAGRTATAEREPLSVRRPDEVVHVGPVAAGELAPVRPGRVHDPQGVGVVTAAVDERDPGAVGRERRRIQMSMPYEVLAVQDDLRTTAAHGCQLQARSV